MEETPHRSNTHGKRAKMGVGAVNPIASAVEVGEPLVGPLCRVMSSQASHWLIRIRQITKMYLNGNVSVR